jgi:hypothetical protein
MLFAPAVTATTLGRMAAPMVSRRLNSGLGAPDLRAVKNLPTDFHHLSNETLCIMAQQASVGEHKVDSDTLYTAAYLVLIVSSAAPSGVVNS